MYPAFNFSLPFYKQFGEHRSMILQILKREANPVSDKNMHMGKNKAWSWQVTILQHNTIKIN